ncbi:MAG: hypothetical protein F6K40_09955 [Okeania sp. SIO3I5]|uniref:hypothetical protein n=1 Tax=Okeania sp. SIO3I5 TaxID=2607805 RepID=UPI0013B6FC83|nr:hypothetical protein [Okeania sp. SIO3I5]NEQ36579.1 hypothetical protein [Okeania sp. SIO3I5]
MKSRQNWIALTNQHIFDKSEYIQLKIHPFKSRKFRKYSRLAAGDFAYLKWKSRQNWIALTNQHIFEKSDISNSKLIHSKVKI